MRIPINLLATLFLGLPVQAQTGGLALADRLAAVDPAKVTAADCEAGMAGASRSNGPDLLHAAWVCFAAKKQVEGAFLLSAGQARSVVDMATMVPASKADADAAVALYGVIYARAGGYGDDVVLRDPAARDRFFGLIDTWSPVYDMRYDPSWRVRRRPDAAAYSAAIAETKAGRRKQLAEVARLLSDDDYYALHRRHDELLERQRNRFVDGTPEAARSADLLRRMDERAVALGVRAPAPADEPGTIMTAGSAPDSPAADERVLPDSADPVIRRCADMAEWRTIAAETKVLRTLVTRSPAWGVIWRADIGRSGGSTERLTCTANSSSSRPLEMGDDKLVPLTKSAR